MIKAVLFVFKRTCDRKKYLHVSSMISTVRNQHLNGITGILRYWWKKREKVVKRFPEVAGVQADEKRHGDTVMGLLEKESKVKKLIYALLLILLGCFIGIHRRVIKAWVTGSKMSEAPEWHTQFCHGLKRRSE